MFRAMVFHRLVRVKRQQHQVELESLFAAKVDTTIAAYKPQLSIDGLHGVGSCTENDECFLDS